MGFGVMAALQTILIDITLLSDISIRRIKPSYRIYLDLHIFTQQHMRAYVTWNTATTPSPTVSSNFMQHPNYTR